jgi:hypothetical protein
LINFTRSISIDFVSLNFSVFVFEKFVDDSFCLVGSGGGGGGGGKFSEFEFIFFLINFFSKEKKFLNLQEQKFFWGNFKFDYLNQRL